MLLMGISAQYQVQSVKCKTGHEHDIKTKQWQPVPCLNTNFKPEDCIQTWNRLSLLCVDLNVHFYVCACVCACVCLCVCEKPVYIIFTEMSPEQRKLSTYSETKGKDLSYTCKITQ